MTAPPRHPSFLELDRAALGLRSAALEQHLETCSECGAYLGRVTQAEPVPAWTRALAADAPVGRRAGWRRWGWPLLATAALASAVLVVLPLPSGEVVDDYVASKGLPAVAVHIKRGEQVFLWDGESLLEPEDRIQLRVASAGYRYVVVFTPGAGTFKKGSGVLYEGPLSDGPETVLPVSWRVDAAGGEERLSLLLSTQPLPHTKAADGVSKASGPNKVWSTQLRLRKRMPQQ